MQMGDPMHAVARLCLHASCSCTRHCCVEQRATSNEQRVCSVGRESHQPAASCSLDDVERNWGARYRVAGADEVEVDGTRDSRRRPRTSDAWPLSF
jgi:hypothetical protein